MPRKRERTPKRNSNIQNESNYQVFISHATADKWIAKVICEKIEGVGASTFRDDRDINGGDDIPEEIRRQIKNSQEMIVLLTPESKDRPWVLFEVGAAWGWRKNSRIIVVLDHVNIDPIPDQIKSRKAIKINEFDNYLIELSTRIENRKHGKT
jgi:predicted nucleotide-binding protein